MHTYTHIYIHAYKFTYTGEVPELDNPLKIHTYIYAYIHTQTHIYVHTNSHTQGKFLNLIIL